LIEKNDEGVSIKVNISNYNDLLKVDFSRFSINIQSNINRKSKINLFI